jgi:hypothetical protein
LNKKDKKEGSRAEKQNYLQEVIMANGKNNIYNSYKMIQKN